LAKRLQLTPLENTFKQDIPESQEAQLHEETLQLVKRALETLTPKERTLLQLKYEDSMSIEEIAQLHNIKASAVKMRLKRSREKVQRLCAQQYAQ
jgi:RNA polymerase sigma factor (sigma-70 family)